MASKGNWCACTILVILVAVVAFFLGRLYTLWNQVRKIRRIVPAALQHVRTRLGNANIDVHHLLESPRLMILRGFLNRDEASQAIADWTARLQRSTVWSKDGREISPQRTSSTANLGRSESPLVQAIERRASMFMGFPREHIEPIQFLRYRPGEFFRPHYDYFPHGAPGTERAIETAGQRNVTIFVYLNDLDPGDRGGCTVFPHLGLRIRPEAGTAVLWHNTLPDGEPDERTFHGGESPHVGEKYALNIWCRERPYVSHQ